MIMIGMKEVSAKKKKSLNNPSSPTPLSGEKTTLITPLDTSGVENNLRLKEKEVPMTETQVAETSQLITTPPPQHEVDEIIRNRVYASLAVGLVPVPLVDLGALAAVQLELIHRLSKAYNLPFNREWVRKALSLILGTLTPIFFAPTVSGLLRYIPVVGPSLGLAGGSLSFATATYLVGHAFAKRFAKGESVEDNDLNSISQEIKSGFEKGKTKVKNLIGGGSSAEPKPEAS
jgi:uncharacterized protein (DUF697 family)